MVQAYENMASDGYGPRVGSVDRGGLEGPWCRETMTLVAENKMRAGYDCRCSGCLAYVKLHGKQV